MHKSSRSPSPAAPAATWSPSSTPAPGNPDAAAVHAAAHVLAALEQERHLIFFLHNALQRAAAEAS